MRLTNVSRAAARSGSFACAARFWLPSVSRHASSLGIHASLRTCAARGRQGAAVLSRGRPITDRREKRRGSVETRPRMPLVKIEPFR